MEDDRISWDESICASTYAELGEVLVRLRTLNNDLREPEAAYILEEAGATGDFEQVRHLLAGSVAGLDEFLGLQERLLDNIRAPYARRERLVDLPATAFATEWPNYLPSDDPAYNLLAPEFRPKMVQANAGYRLLSYRQATRWAREALY